MTEFKDEVFRFAEKFSECREILSALGDENRQHLILEMMLIDKCEGVRVGEIVEKTHLSRPAVSHHIKILKEAGILKMRREGTKNYYFFDSDTRAINQIIDMLEYARLIMERLPGLRAENDENGGEI